MNALILLETRRADVNDCLDRHLKYLPTNWNPVIICSEQNADMIGMKKIIIPPITSYPQYLNDYNFLFASAEFYDNFLQYERILICHQDSGLLREGIEEFIEWDYVGAPWIFQHHGGNGGLSLRNPAIMKQICKMFQYTRREGNEDVFFSNKMFEHKIGALAPRDVCTLFSCETIFELGTLGYHGIENYQKGQRYTVDEIMSQYYNLSGKL